MESWLLGYCHFCPDGTRPGRITVLASLRLINHRDFVVDRQAEDLHEEIGPSGTVFWPQYPAAFQDLARCLVRFRTNQTYEYGDLTTAKDWLKVKDRQGTWEVHRIGFRIVEQGPDLQWEQDPRWLKGFPEGERVFVRQRGTDTLLGPWRVGREIASEAYARELVPHPSPHKVFEYAIKDLSPESIYSKRLTNGPLLEALLYGPDETNGQFVDLATPKQLAKWLVERMISVAPQIVIRFDREIPGWRTKVKDEIEGYGEAERHLFRSRWEQLEPSLDQLAFEAESVEKLLDHPRFLARFQDLVSLMVAAKVAARVNEIEGEAQKKVRITLDRLEGETREFEGRYKETKARFDKVEKEVQARLETAAARELALTDLQSHLESSRERLLKDVAIYQSLLPVAANNSHTVTSPSPSSPILPQPEAEVKPTGPAIEVGATFIDSRLWPSLARWHPGVPKVHSVILHAAVCGSKAVIIPSPAWARAYADALGALARLTVVNIEPVWLGFKDLWKGGLGECWERASRDQSQIELVLLRDFNRALPQCYARPLLDVIAGYCNSLPNSAKLGWPKTLRLLACPAPAEEALPLTTEVVRHFAAIQRILGSAVKEGPKQLAQGHVTTETWRHWAKAAPPTLPEQDLVNIFGPLACSAAADTATIAQVLKAVGMEEREAKRTAYDTRVIEPSEYLTLKDSDIGTTR